MQQDVRWLIMNFPEKAITEACALEIMFDSSLPSDVNFQLKVSPVYRVRGGSRGPFSELICYLVFAVLGTCQSYRSFDILLARLW
jgi:hypothetical protein